MPGVSSRPEALEATTIRPTPEAPALRPPAPFEAVTPVPAAPREPEDQPSPFVEAPPAEVRPPLRERALARARALSWRLGAAVAAVLATIAIATWALWPTNRATARRVALEAPAEVAPAPDPEPAFEPLPEPPSLQEAAALVIQGRAREAARAYAALAAAHPDRPEFATMARLLARGALAGEGAR